MVTLEEFVRHLADLKSGRNALKTQRRARRRAPTRAMRTEIAAKTNGRCHVCSGPLDAAWHADHVVAHAGGGDDSPANFLPACSTCNGYRWFFQPAELHLILKLGVWAADQVRSATPIGREIGSRFLEHDRRRSARRKRPAAGRTRAATTV